MYRNLSPQLLGIMARQSELIELVLNYNFRGLDVDMDELLKRALAVDVAAATCFLTSGGVEIGTFELPIDLRVSDADFEAFVQKLPVVAELCESLTATRAVVTLPTCSDELAFQENFERFRSRLAVLAVELQKHGVRIGLALDVACDLRNESNYEFVVKVDQLTALVQTAGQGLGIVLDVWNWFVGGGTLEGIQALTADQLLAVRISDVPAGIDIAAATTADQALPAKDGQLPIAQVLEHLSSIEFDGPVSVYASSSTFQGVNRERTIEIIKRYLDAFEANLPFPGADAVADETAVECAEEATEDGAKSTSADENATEVATESSTEVATENSTDDDTAADTVTASV
jgi:sugar phosphate isomerase/epimerase